MKNPFTFYKNFVKSDRDYNKLTRADLIFIIKQQAQELNDKAFNSALKKLAEVSLKKYEKSLKQAAEYFAGERSLNKLNPRARRIAMFFISTANTFQKLPELNNKEGVDRVYEYTKIKLLPAELQFTLLELLQEGQSFSRTSFKQERRAIATKNEKEEIECGYNILKTNKEIKKIKEELWTKKR